MLKLNICPNQYVGNQKIKIGETMKHLSHLISVGILLFLSIKIILPSQCFSQDNDIPAEEDIIIEEIINEGIGDRFVIEEIKPRDDGTECRLTIKEVTSLTSRYVTEFPEDKILFSMFGKPELWGKFSIHRYDGRIKYADNYCFIGEGDIMNRLTFVLLDEGYVYVRGKGRVILPNKEEVELGY